MSHQSLHEVPVSHLIAAVLQSDSLLSQLQREIYRAVPGVSIEQLRQLLRDQILRADMINGPKANEAESLLQRITQLRAKGLSMTQTLKVVTGQEKAARDDEDVYRVLIDDMRNGGEGG
jgi:hypothetical protein